MKESDLTFLQELIDAPSPTGCEVPVANVLKKRLQGCADLIETNVMGSVHATLKGTEGTSSVMFASHIDEIGLMVCYIDDNGFLYVNQLGGVDAAVLPGMRVNIHTKNGVLHGVIGRKAIHLLKPEDRKKVTPLEELYIDIGYSKKDAEEKVRIGDPVTFDVGLERFGDNFVVGRALDDKMGVWISARVMEEVKAAGGAKVDYICAGTVQEEIGLRGAETSTYSINPDVAIAIDVGHATDYPNVKQTQTGVSECGKGPLIARGPNINPVLFEMLACAADKCDVPYQIAPENRGTGTDANVMQLTRGGKATGLISVSLRYMHTPSEVLALKDLDYAVKMLTQFVLDLEPNTDFTPR